MVIGDMPFMSYQTSVYDAVKNAGRFIQEGGAYAVKLEGGATVCDRIEAITKASIPVVAHIGLTPQSVNAFGGFKVQGKDEARARELIVKGKKSILINTKAMYNDIFNDNREYFCYRNAPKKGYVLNISGKAHCVCCNKQINIEMQYKL